jgi:phage shock protein E
MEFLRGLFGGRVPTTSAPDLQERLAKNSRGIYLLDVREPVEFRRGHIAGAKLIPLRQLGGRLKEIPKEREIVCICATGHRSVPAVRQLVAAGYKAASLEHGMIAWQRARLPVKKG